MCILQHKRKLTAYKVIIRLCLHHPRQHRYRSQRRSTCSPEPFHPLLKTLGHNIEKIHTRPETHFTIRYDTSRVFLSLIMQHLRRLT